MDFTIFILTIILILGLLWFGYSRQAFGFAYFGMALAIFLGLFLMSGGLDLQTGNYIASIGNDFNVTQQFTNHTTTNDFFVNIVSLLLFYGGIFGVVLTTFIAVRQY